MNVPLPYSASTSGAIQVFCLIQAKRSNRFGVPSEKIVRGAFRSRSRSM